MSMNAQLRQASPRVLSLLQEQPELTYAALHWQCAAPAGSDDPLAGLPASTRAIFGCLPPEAQRMAAAQHAQMMEKMLATNPMLAGMLAGQEEEGDDLRAMGITDDDLPDAIDIRKAWHGLHFVLADKAWETAPGAGQAVLGGRETGEDESGYGPVRVLDAAETADVAAALVALGEEDVAARYDAAAMRAAKIYGGWADDPEYLEWLLETFRDVRDYYAAARQRGYGMLLAIT